MTHELKIQPKYFRAILDGNDRGYKVGDKVVLKEWKDDKYLGGEIHGVIKYMIGDEFEGLQDGYVVFSIGIYKIVRSAD